MLRGTSLETKRVSPRTGDLCTWQSPFVRLVRALANSNPRFPILHLRSRHSISTVSLLPQAPLFIPDNVPTTSMQLWLIPGISSDMYFGRGHHDPSHSTESQTRLAQFSGATAISSNAYFGRPEEDEEEEHGGQGDGMLGLGDNETIQGLERGIRDMAGRVMANPEVQNLGDQIRQGALKVGDGRDNRLNCDHFASLDSSLIDSYLISSPPSKDGVRRLTTILGLQTPLSTVIQPGPIRSCCHSVLLFSLVISLSGNISALSIRLSRCSSRSFHSDPA